MLPLNYNINDTTIFLNICYENIFIKNNLPLIYFENLMYNILIRYFGLIPFILGVIL